MKVRAGASVAAAALLAAGLSGCSLFAVHQTMYPYDPSDGVSAQVGDVAILNALVITEDGEDGNFSGAAVNAGDDDVALTLQYSAGGETVEVEVEVPAGATVTLGASDAQLLLPGIDSIPGSLLEIYFTDGSAAGVKVPVPVLDATLEAYEELVPMPVPTPEPTETPGSRLQRP